MRTTGLTRRQFVKGSAVIGAAATMGFPAIVRARGLNEKLQVAFVAVGGRAKAHTKATEQAGCQCVAFAEVDKTRWGGVLDVDGWSKAKGYTDWRKIFENHAKEVDVLFVATPDHTHFAPSMTAVSMGIHCYTEKPLTWSVREAQLLEKAYAKNTKVVTQMGNQGHSKQGWRIACEFRRDRRGEGVPYLDQPPGLAAGWRPPGLDRPGARSPRLGRVDRRRADAPLRRPPWRKQEGPRPLPPVQLARHR
jgi:hypothetical protein